MSYISDTMRYEFESVPIELKNHILEKNVKIKTVRDLGAALKGVITEPETPENGELRRLARETLDELRRRADTAGMAL